MSPNLPHDGLAEASREFAVEYPKRMKHLHEAAERMSEMVEGKVA
jgi:hypothetical protein